MKHAAATDPSIVQIVSCGVCDKRYVLVQEGDTPPARACLCGAKKLAPTRLPAGIYELASPATSELSGETEKKESHSFDEDDVGYGRSHGYEPGHGGPAGPGDSPAPGNESTPTGESLSPDSSD